MTKSTQQDKISDHVQDIRNWTMKLLLQVNKLMVVGKVNGRTIGLTTIHEGSGGL